MGKQKGSETKAEARRSEDDEKVMTAADLKGRWPHKRLFLSLSLSLEIRLIFFLLVFFFVFRRLRSLPGMASPSPPPRGSRCKQCGRTRTVHAQDRHGDRRRNFLKKWKRRGRKGPRRPPPTFGIPGDANEKKEKRMRIESAKVWYSVNEQKKTHTQSAKYPWMKKNGMENGFNIDKWTKKTIKERVLKRTAKTNSGGEKKTLKRWEKKDVPPPFFFKPPSFQLFVICYLWLEAVEAKKNEKQERDEPRKWGVRERPDRVAGHRKISKERPAFNSSRAPPVPRRMGPYLGGRRQTMSATTEVKGREREREREKEDREKNIEGEMYILRPGCGSVYTALP